MAQVDFKKWVCDACGYIYDEAEGDPDSGLAPGTRFEDIPDDWECPLCGLTKSDLRLLPEVILHNTMKRPVTNISKKSSKSKGGDDYIVVVGAGIAGWSVIESIRQQDSSVPILLVTACNGVFYPKPAISTALAKGKSAEQLIEQQGVDKAEQYGIEIRTETRVIKIDTTKKRLTTAKGGIQYGKLILALGASQKEVSINGDAADSIFRINDLKSYSQLRKQLEKNIEHISILGAGLIGCEFAEDLTSAGYQVDVLDIADHALASLLPFQVSNELETTLQSRGVNWRFNTGLDSLEKQGAQYRATLSDGQVVITDLVISAVGLSPNIKLANKSSIACNVGVIVNEHMKTSMEDIYALGDCAEFEGEIYAYIEPIRRQAKVIALSLYNANKVFEPKPPLIRVKTPSFPLSICLSQKLDKSVSYSINLEDNNRVDYIQQDQPIGFVLSGESSKNSMAVYSELFD